MRFASYMARQHVKLAARWEKYPKSMTALFFVGIAAKVASAVVERRLQRRS